LLQFCMEAAGDNKQFQLSMFADPCCQAVFANKLEPVSSGPVSKKDYDEVPLTTTTLAPEPTPAVPEPTPEEPAEPEWKDDLLNWADQAAADATYPCELKSCISAGRGSRCLMELRDCEEEFQEGWCPDINKAFNLASRVYGKDSAPSSIIAEAVKLCDGGLLDMDDLFDKYEDVEDLDGPCTFGSCLAAADPETCQKQSEACVAFAKTVKDSDLGHAVNAYGQVDASAAAVRVNAHNEQMKEILDILEKTKISVLER